jgi:hypothetical protein
LLLLFVAAFAVNACGDGTNDVSQNDATTLRDDNGAAATSQTVESTTSQTASDDEPTTIQPPLDLAGTTWVPTDYRQSDGSITNALGDDVLIVFGEDGTLSGHTGCNEFAGTWETTGPYYDYDEGEEAFDDKKDGQPISLSAELTTDVVCEGFYGDQDVDLLASIVGAEIWYIGSTLGDEGAGSITLSGENALVYADSA